MKWFQSNTFKTKQFWCGLGTVLTGVGFIVSGSIPEGAVLIMNGLNSIMNRDAITKVEY